MPTQGGLTYNIDNVLVDVVRRTRGTGAAAGLTPDLLELLKHMTPGGGEDSEWQKELMKK